MKTSTKYVQDALRASCKALSPIANKETSESYRRIQEALQEVEKYAGGYKGKKALDIGCSIGVHAIAASILGASVTGVDKFTFPNSEVLSPFQLTEDEFQTVQSAWKKNGITVQESDLDKALPFENKTFDIITMNAVIEHLNGTHKHVLDECIRVLKPGGYFLISTPNVAAILKRIRFILGMSPNWDLKDFYFSERNFTGHTREFTTKEISDMASFSGFQIIRAFAKPTYFRKKWFRNPKKFASIVAFCLGFLTPRLGDHVFVLAQKPKNNIM